MELNLLGRDKIKELRENKRNYRVRKICFFVIAGCLALVIILVLIFTFLKISDANLSSDIKRNKTALTELISADLDRNLTIQKTLSKVESFHNKKQNFTLILEFIKNLNLDIEYSSILISDDGKVVISGLANGFQALDSLKNSLKNAKFSFELDSKKRTENLFGSVEIAEGATEFDKKVNFSINAQYNTDVLSFTANSASVVKDEGVK